GGPEILALVLGIKRVERGADLDVAIGPRVVGAPQFLAAVDVECRDVDATAELAAGVADDDLVLDDERRRREGLAEVDLADLRPPGLLSRRRIDGDDVRIEQAVDDL